VGLIRNAELRQGDEILRVGGRGTGYQASKPRKKPSTSPEVGILPGGCHFTRGAGKKSKR